MRNYVLAIIILIQVVLIGCGSSSKNIATNNRFFIRGGVHQTLKWDDRLEFDRTSWFHELSMLFDVLTVEIKKDNPFYNWFSDFEKRQISKCEHYLVILSYALDEDRISDLLFISELKKNGYVLSEIPHFRDNIKLHPEYRNELLQYYKVRGACKHSGSVQKITINFPSFNTETIGPIK